VKNWPTPTKVAIVVRMTYLTLWVIVGLVLVAWIARFSLGYALVILLVLLGPKIASWIFTYKAFARGPQAGRGPEPISTQPINESMIRDELSKAETVHLPDWVREETDEWLATTDRAEKSRKRVALLDRLYDYASNSTDHYAARSAVNQLRLAINPWVRD
jgi:hypothetical protein